MSCMTVRTMFGRLAPAIVAAMVLSGCGRESEVGMLKAAAKKIATAEIAKFNAAELQYKDKVVFNGIGELLPDMDYGNGVFLKRYRKFTGYKLKDIVKTRSIIAPYILVIEYDYDFMMTQPRAAKSSTDRAAAKLAEKDTKYHSDRCHLIRRYHCDAKGNFIGKISNLPPLESYYIHGVLPPEESVLTGTS